MTHHKIRPFLFEGQSQIRWTLKNGKPWFVTVDVCRALGIVNASQAVEGLDDDEKDISFTYTPGGDQGMLIVSEGGLFTLILRCRDALKKGTLPHRFRRWVTDEVIPAIYAEGRQLETGMPEALKVRLVAEARQTFGIHASAGLWFALDLPVVPAMRVPPAQTDLFMTWPTKGSEPSQPNV